jgi:hypothetical protein
VGEAELAELERLVEAAPPGRWFYAGTSELDGAGLHVLDSRATGDIGEFYTREAADFCAAARDAVPKLIAAVRERDARIAQLEAGRG